ncbi:MAG: aromatic ring-hydroxylating dioxygenase subunit alpha [Myxococcota bacterium]|nr:aromatic ring-hydroxylating dioxygenase subunit alpha [Myxococcota bacterium]
MSRSRLVEITRRHIAHAVAGTVDQAPGIHTVPAAHYSDPQRWQLEVDRIFRRLPLLLAFSTEFPKPHSYRALEVSGVSILLVRNAKGIMRAFVNMCSHRGAQVVPDGTGEARRFLCPYHAWAYDSNGALVGVRNSGEFGEVDPSCHGLTPLPVSERAGMIFGVLSPAESFDFDAFFCGYDKALDLMGFAGCQVVGRQAVEGPNWKIAYDGYLDFYHLPILHRESFGTEIGDKAVYDAWGPHQKVSMPLPYLSSLEKKPEDEWPESLLLAGIWTIFPHVSIGTFDADGPFFMISQLFPGDRVDSSITYQTFLSPAPPGEENREGIEKQMKFLQRVVRDEDYAVGKTIGRNLATGAKPNALFGRNEGGGQRFHSWVDALIEAEESDLPEIFSRKIGPEVS